MWHKLLYSLRQLGHYIYLTHLSEMCNRFFLLHCSMDSITISIFIFHSFLDAGTSHISQLLQLIVWLYPCLDSRCAATWSSSASKTENTCCTYDRTLVHVSSNTIRYAVIMRMARAIRARFWPQVACLLTLRQVNMSNVGRVECWFRRIHYHVHETLTMYNDHSL